MYIVAKKKKSEVSLLLSNLNCHFKSQKGHKRQRYYILLKVSTHQEDIIIMNIFLSKIHEVKIDRVEERNRQI